MAVRMATLTRTSSGLWTSRKVIPADVREAYGKREEKPTWPATFTRAQACAEFGVWLTKVEDRITILRASGDGPLVDLSERQTAALAGLWYAEAVERFSENPGGVEGWEAALEAICPSETAASWHLAMLGDAREYEGPWVETPYLVSECDSLLSREGLRLASAASQRLLQEMAGRYAALCKLMMKRAQGDFSDDPALASLPSWSRPGEAETAARPGPKAASDVSIAKLFDGYVERVGPAPATVKAWRRMLNHLSDFLGHDDAERVSPDDIIAWTDHLLTEPTRRGAIRSAKTVREGYLSAAKAVFGWAREQRKVSSDPAAGLRVRGPKRQRLRDAGLSDAEAQVILRATFGPHAGKLTQRHALARRWVPWLCAYTGARVNEMTQLRKQDILQEDGIWAVRITPEAGSVKDHAARLVPLHSGLIEQGFVTMVAEAPDGPLFYDPKSHRGGSEGNPQYKKVGERLAAWVRSLGVTGDVAPNHGWRHRFKTEGRAADMDSKALDVIQGHAAASEGDKYGGWKMRRLKKEIELLPRIILDEPAAASDAS